MQNNLQTSLDAFGRIFLPKEIRNRLHWNSGSEFELIEDKNQLILKPIIQKAEIIKKGKWMVVNSKQPLSENSIIESLQQVRSERSK